jgi:hypothetical protein
MYKIRMQLQTQKPVEQRLNALQVFAHECLRVNDIYIYRFCKTVGAIRNLKVGRDLTKGGLRSIYQGTAPTVCCRF